MRTNYHNGEDVLRSQRLASVHYTSQDFGDDILFQPEIFSSILFAARETQKLGTFKPRRCYKDCEKAVLT